jgi:hypothetical protein
MKATEEAGTLKTSDGSVIGHASTQYPPSSYIDDDVRVQTAFYALMELNRKLAWAERMGFPAPTTTSTNQRAIKFKEVGDDIPCQQSDLAMMRYCHQ